MNWVCLNCQAVFDEPKSVKEYLIHDPYPDGPTIAVCPHCGYDEFVEAIKCDGCEEYIIGKYIRTCNDECYCEDCYTEHDVADL